MIFEGFRIDSCLIYAPERNFQLKYVIESCLFFEIAKILLSL